MGLGRGRRADLAQAAHDEDSCNEDTADGGEVVSLLVHCFVLFGLGIRAGEVGIKPQLLRFT